MKKKMHITLPL